MTSFFRRLNMRPKPLLSSFSFVGLIGRVPPRGPLGGGGSVSRRKSARSPMPPLCGGPLKAPCSSLACSCCLGLRSTCLVCVGCVGRWASVAVPFWLRWGDMARASMGGS